MPTPPLRGKKLKDLKPLGIFNGRTVVVPIVAFTMATLLFVYTRSSIYAAKKNAKRHREADGGQISWRNESQRRHGVLERPAEKLDLRGLVGVERIERKEVRWKGRQMSKEEEAVRAKSVRRGDGKG